MLDDLTPTELIEVPPVLDNVIKILSSENRWCQGSMFGKGDGKQDFTLRKEQAKSFCLVGAISASMPVAGVTGFLRMQTIFADGLRVMDRGIVHFNDTNNHREVMSRLEDFKERLRFATTEE